MNVGRHDNSGRALMVMTLDGPPSSDQLDQIKEISDIHSARLVQL